MSWEDRVNPSIEFVSPSGREFEAQWIGGERSKGKKLGQFSAPRQAGTIIQDLSVEGTVYPLDFIFDGENNDLLARLFFETCSEEGVWEITHPMYGDLELQLSSVTEVGQPVTSGGLTQIKSVWLEPLKDDDEVSKAELADQIEQQLKKINESSADQLEAVSDQSTASRIQTLKDAADTVSTIISSSMETIAELNSAVARITNSIQRATANNLSNPIVQIQSLATQIQQAAQIPSLATDNIKERLDSYSTGISNLLNNNATEPTPEQKNFLAMKEVGLVAMSSTLSRVVSTGSLTTKQEAITFAESLSNTLDSITNSLDQDQSLFDGQVLENQYFSQSQSYSDSIKIISLGIEYLLRASFDLKIEKRFTLKKDRAPIEIAFTEYGGPGENNENFDLFIESNNLKSTDILLLPAGREVLIYV